MDATYSIATQRGDSIQAKALHQAHNLEFNLLGAGYMLNRAPDYYVYLYNISEQVFNVSRPPLLKGFKIEAKAPGTKYKLCARFPQPLLVPKGNVDSNEIDIVPQETRRFVMDIINPDNLGIDQDAVLDPSQVYSVGNNLGAKGVFWSLNGPGASKHGYKEEPEDSEIERATVRLEAFYKARLDKADAVAASTPGDLNTYLSPEDHLAVSYFGENRTWSGKKARTDFCEMCGERVKASAAFHRMEDGSLCVRDWDRTIKAGARTRAQAYEATEDEKYAPKVPPVASAPLSAPVASKVDKDKPENK